MIRLYSQNYKLIPNALGSSFRYLRNKRPLHAQQESNSPLSSQARDQIFERGYKAGFRAGSAKERIRQAENNDPNPLIEKLSFWKANDPINSETESKIEKIKKEFYTLGYMEAQERKMAARKAGYQEGYAKGLAVGFAKGKKFVVEKMMKEAPAKAEQLYHRFLKYLTPK